MASTRLTRTTGAGNRQKWTWSGWIKRNNISYGDAYLMGVYVHGADHFRFYFPSTDQLHVKFYNNTSYDFFLNYESEIPIDIIWNKKVKAIMPIPFLFTSDDSWSNITNTRCNIKNRIKSNEQLLINTLKINK